MVALQVISLQVNLLINLQENKFENGESVKIERKFDSDLNDYFIHSSVGNLVYDKLDIKQPKSKSPYWARVYVDKGILDFYFWLAEKKGIKLDKGVRGGPHITFIRGEEPKDKSLWGYEAGEVEFRYSNIIRMDNGYHAWLDVYSEQLNDIRLKLGYPPKPEKILSNGFVKAMSYHLTIGRM